MPHNLRHRFWIEIFFALATSVLGVATLFWHSWIETIFGVDPDKGSGSAEWLVVVLLTIVTVALVIGARLEWRHASLAGR